MAEEEATTTVATSRAKATGKVEGITPKAGASAVAVRLQRPLHAGVERESAELSSSVPFYVRRRGPHGRTCLQEACKRPR